MGLAEIEARVAKKDWDEALTLALEEWRACKAPAWANLIDAISAKISIAPVRPRTGEFGRNYDEWHFRARSEFAVDIPVLLDAFGVDLVVHDEQPRSAFDLTGAGWLVMTALAREGLELPHGVRGPFMAVAGRLDHLRRRGPDPRTPKGLVRFLELAPVVTSGVLATATYGPVLDYIADVGDTRILPALEALAPTPARDRAIKALNAVADPMLANEAEVMDLARSLGFVPRAARVDVSELLELVAADLADDTPRAILADMWLEAGDARGEFVALQLRAAKGQTSEAELDRMNTLEAQGKNEWLANLALIVRDARFHRGFLDEITLEAATAVTNERWRQMTQHPGLATVRMLRPGLAPHTLVGLFINALPNLEELEVASVASFRALIEGPRPPRLTRIELDLPWTPAPRGTSRPPSRPAPSFEVSALLELGFERVTVPYAEPRTIAEHVLLLLLATEKGSVVLRAMDARFTATRGHGGLMLDIESRDSFTVNAVLEACPDATISLRRPKGASLYGYNGDAMRLNERLKALGHHRVTLDASWRKLMKR